MNMSYCFEEKVNDHISSYAFFNAYLSEAHPLFEYIVDTCARAYLVALWRDACIHADLCFGFINYCACGKRMKIIIDGEPIAKKRHKCKCVSGHGFVYDPQVKDEMQPIKDEIKRQWDLHYFDPNSEYHQESHTIDRSEAIIVSLTFYSSPSKSLSNPRLNAKLWGLSRNTEKPDIDNLAKLYLDCMTGIIWPDDSIVTTLCATKLYSKHPRTVIEIKEAFNIKNNLKPCTIKFMETVSPSQYSNMINDFNKIIYVLTNNQEPYEEIFNDDSRMDRSFLLSEASMLLIEFAKKHADRLKKIAKIEVK